MQRLSPSLSGFCSPALLFIYYSSNKQIPFLFFIVSHPPLTRVICNKSQFTELLWTGESNEWIKRAVCCHAFFQLSSLQEQGLQHAGAELCLLLYLSLATWAIGIESLVFGWSVGPDWDAQKGCTWSTFKDAKALMSISCFDFFQRNPAAVVQLQGDGDPASHGGSGLGPPGWRANLRHLPQDQVRRWLREPVFLLPDQVLCPLWGASLPSIQHGKREKRGVTMTFSSAIYFIISW